MNKAESIFNNFNDNWLLNTNQSISQAIIKLQKCMNSHLKADDLLLRAFSYKHFWLLKIRKIYFEILWKFLKYRNWPHTFSSRPLALEIKVFRPPLAYWNMVTGFYGGKAWKRYVFFAIYIKTIDFFQTCLFTQKKLFFRLKA